MIETALKLNNITVTADIEKEIIKHLRRQQEEYDKQLYLEGIPEKLKTFFSITRKKDLISYGKRVRISEDELFLLIHNCSQIGFKHRSKFPQFVPQDRKILDSDEADLKQGNPLKIRNKIKRIFEERKNYMVHLFERGKEWHLFYYTYKDMETGDKSHWKHGSHLHYVSHLWPEYKKRQLWESFDNRNINIQGVHIRLETVETPVHHYKLEIPSELLTKFKEHDK